jgi:hypothetical protein
VSAGGGLCCFSPGIGIANTEVRFDDILTVVDNNVPPGTPVQLGFDWTLDGSIAAFGQVLNDGTESRAFSNVGGLFQADVENGTGLLANLVLDQQYCADTLLNGCGPSRPGRAVFPAGQVNFAAVDLFGIITTTPGARIDMSGVLSNDSTAQGAVDVFSCGASNCFTDLDASAGSDFTHTAILTVIPLTPGLSFESASGASYLSGSNSAPEPNTGLLLACGLLMLAGTAFRRSKTLRTANGAMLHSVHLSARYLTAIDQD